MDIYNILKNVDPRELKKTFSKITSSFNPSQQKEINYAIDNLNDPGVIKKLKNIDSEKINEILKQNPEIKKKLNMDEGKRN